MVHDQVVANAREADVQVEDHEILADSAVVAIQALKVAITLAEAKDQVGNAQAEAKDPADNAQVVAHTLAEVVASILVVAADADYS